MISTGIMIIGVLGMVGEFFFFEAKAKVSTYALYGVASRVIFTVGVLLGIFEGDGTIFGIIAALIFLGITWVFQIVSVKAYKDMKESREAVDELLK